MNVFFVKYDVATGRILWSGNTQATALEQDPSVLVTSELVDVQTNRVLNGAVVPLPPKPDGYFEFDYTLGQWVPDIASADLDATSKRNSLLQSSDWTQLPDVPLETKQAWATYRQALRDITTQEGYPFNVIWPTKPE